MGDLDDFSKLTRELEKEKEIKLDIAVTIKDLEETVEDMETYLRKVDEQCEKAEDDEWKIRYDFQNSVNTHLTDEKRWLKRELDEIKQKSYYEQYPDALNHSLEQVTEEELIRLVKHMERLKSNCEKELKQYTLNIEEQHRRFRAQDTTRKAYKTDLSHAEEAEQQKKVEKLVDKHMKTVRPSYSPAYIEHLEKQPVKVCRVSYDELKSRQLMHSYRR